LLPYGAHAHVAGDKGFAIGIALDSHQCTPEGTEFCRNREMKAWSACRRFFAKAWRR
jgi:hypothetical protein